ncbi:roadblock/LC7 domain-containing protein [Streptomyces sp. NPDC050287]|uniref:roadblock/LC7 domain-containing protein n=1 Tax=Streptomyces sp. NPDC050287 TaxID=3365608 RepID=UPI0037987A92
MAADPHIQPGIQATPQTGTQLGPHPDIQEELRRLRARVPQLTGALATGPDGLVLAQDTPGIAPQNLAALTTSARELAVRLTQAAGQGDDQGDGQGDDQGDGFRELLVRGGHGYVATYAAGRTAVLTLLAEDRVPVGRLHLEGRRAGVRIGELVDARAPDTAEAPVEVPVETPAKAPAKQSRPAAKAGPARARTARTPRATTTNTRSTTDS